MIADYSSCHEALGFICIYPAQVGPGCSRCRRKPSYAVFVEPDPENWPWIQRRRFYECAFARGYFTTLLRNAGKLLTRGYGDYGTKLHSEKDRKNHPGGRFWRSGKMWMLPGSAGIWRFSRSRRNNYDYWSLPRLAQKKTPLRNTPALWCSAQQCCYVRWWVRVIWELALMLIFSLAIPLSVLLKRLSMVVVKRRLWRLRACVESFQIQKIFSFGVYLAYITWKSPQLFDDLPGIIILHKFLRD